MRYCGGCCSRLVLVSILYLARRPKMPAGPTLKIHLQRGIITVFMAFLFFWALIHVPIAEAVALSFIAPIIALYLAAVFLGETIHRNAIFASVLGLAGVVVIGWGKMSGDYTNEELLGFGAVLLSALLYAANLVIQRSQALLADPIEISFFPESCRRGKLWAGRAVSGCRTGCPICAGISCSGIAIDHFCAVHRLGLCAGSGTGADQSGI